MKRRLSGGTLAGRVMILAALSIFVFTLLAAFVPVQTAHAAPGDAGDPQATWINRGNIKYNGKTYRLTDRVVNGKPVFVVIEEWCTAAGGGFANKADGGYLVLQTDSSVTVVPSADASCQQPTGPYSVATIMNLRVRHIWFYKDGPSGETVFLYNNPSITFLLTDVAPGSPYSGGKVYTRDGATAGNTCPETMLEHGGKWYLFPMMTLDAMNAIYPNTPSRELLSEDYTKIMTNGETNNCRVAPEKVVTDYRVGNVLEFPANSTPDSHSYAGENIVGSFCTQVLLPQGPIPRYFNEIERGFSETDVFTHDVITTCEDDGPRSSVRTAQRHAFHQITKALNPGGSKEIHWDQHGIYEFAISNGFPDLAILGDDNGYIISQGVSEIIPDNPTEVGAAPAVAGQVEDCSKYSDGFGWVVCPMTGLFSSIAGWIDEQITSLLKVNACRIFHTTGSSMPGCSSSPNEVASSNAFYTAWKVFRTMAYALLVILGLVMVVSQIVGLELFDAYAIRKMLPKLVIAAIFIPLLWPLLRMVTVMANVSADAVTELIKGPFMFLSHNVTVGDFFTGAGLGIVGVGAVAGAVVFAFIGGPGVLLALFGAVILALGQALFVITVRDMVFFLLVLASPLAVAAGIFEPFKKMFSLWRRFLTGILLSIPAVAAVLAISKVAAALARVAHPELGIFFAVVFIVVGYLLFWPILKSVDKVAGQVDGMTDKATGGIQKRLAKYRNDTVKRRWGEIRDEQRGNLEKGKRGAWYNPARYARQAASITDRVVAAGKPGGKLFGAAAERAQQAHALHVADEALKRDNNQEAGNDDLNEAIKGAHSTSHAVDRLARRYGRKVAAGSKDASGRTLKEAEEAHKATLAGGQFASEDERWKWRQQWIGAREAAQTDADRAGHSSKAADDVARWQSSFGFDGITGAARVAAGKALSNSNTSMREEAYRSFDEALATDVAMDDELIKEGIISDSDATSIKVANKGRERAAAGWSGQYKLLTDKDASGNLKPIEERIKDFKRAALTGSGPGATIGQRWEQSVALFPELATMLHEVDADLSPQFKTLVLQGQSAGLTPQQAATAARTQISQQRQGTKTSAQQQIQTFAQAFVANPNDPALQTHPFLPRFQEIARQRDLRVSEGVGSGLTQVQAVQQADRWRDAQIQAVQEQHAIAATYATLDPTEVDAAMERFAIYDGVYKLSGQVSRLAAEPLKQQVSSQVFEFAGEKMSAEEWVRFLEGPSAPPDLAERFRQARFSYGAQAEASRQAGAVVGGGQAGQMPNPGGSDRRIKTAIVPLAVVNDIQLYRFRYLFGEQVYVGVMAQDLLQSHPEAVLLGEYGFYLVDYAGLGLRMCTIEEWHKSGARAALLERANAKHNH